MSLRLFARKKAVSLSSRFLQPAAARFEGPGKASPFPTTRNFSASQFPTKEDAKAMRCTMSTMDNETLTIIANMGNHAAGCEVLKRHIMTVDNADYHQACATFAEIEKVNQAFDMKTFPYFAGIASGVAMTTVSLPMVFYLPTAKWFNEKYVTTDVPEAVDLETFLEVGSWTWNWMEPPFGTLSFMLLCIQFTRSQIQNLGIRPYTEMIIEMRAERLAKQFPQYDQSVLVLYSESEDLVKNTWLSRFKKLN